MAFVEVTILGTGAEFLEKYRKGEFNKRFIISRTAPNEEGNFYLNIWRKTTEDGIFSMPIQCWIRRENCKVPVLNRWFYMNVKPNVWYDVETEPEFVEFITQQSKLCKSMVRKIKRDLNKIDSGLTYSR